MPLKHPYACGGLPTHWASWLGSAWQFPLAAPAAPPLDVPAAALPALPALPPVPPPDEPPLEVPPVEAPPLDEPPAEAPPLAYFPPVPPAFVPPPPEPESEELSPPQAETKRATELRRMNRFIAELYHRGVSWKAPGLRSGAGAGGLGHDLPAPLGGEGHSARRESARVRFSGVESGATGGRGAEREIRPRECAR